MAKKAIFTLDTGGSKSHAVVFDENGAVINESYFEGLGLAEDNIDKPIIVLREKITEMLDGLSYQIYDIVVNLGGKNVCQLTNELKLLFPEAKITVLRESSGVLAEVLRKSDGADALIMAGTGVIVFVGGENGNFISDGWGADLGDEGSGYWIGREILRDALRSFEEIELSFAAKEITGFSESFGAVTDLEEQMRLRDSVRKKILPLSRAKIASFARIGVSAVASGDKKATEIFENAGKHIADSVIRALDKCGVKCNPKILIIGGLTGCYELWGKTFEEQIKKNKSGIQVKILKEDLTVAAYKYYYINKER